MLGENARKSVAGAACAERDNDPHGMLRPAIGQSGRRGQRRQNCQRQADEEACQKGISRQIPCPVTSQSQFTLYNFWHLVNNLVLMQILIMERFTAFSVGQSSERGLTSVALLPNAI
jgi:hypothetical protein